MSDLKNGPLKRTHDSLDLASIPVQGEPAAKNAARRALRFVLGTAPLFPGSDYDEIDVNFAVSVTGNPDIIRARLLRPTLVLVAALSIGAAVPGVVDIVRHEYGQQPAVDQSDNTSKPDLLPTPAAPTIEPSANAQKAH